MNNQLAVATIDALGTAVAVLDAGGHVVWVSTAWRHATEAGADPLTGVDAGSDLVGVLRRMTDRGAARAAEALAEVARGSRALAVAELYATDGSVRWHLITRQLPPPRAGAVVTRSDVANSHLGVPAATTRTVNVPQITARLSPRELEVLRLMTQGLDNRQIAIELGITYTTVRSHTRSLIDKLGARSRLDAVARVYRSGIRAMQ